MKTLHLIIGLMLLLAACTKPVQIENVLAEQPPLFPDYTGVTIPPNIAPLNFALQDSCQEARALITFEGDTLEVRAKRRNQFIIPPSPWAKLLERAKGGQLSITLQAQVAGRWVAYAPFHIQVATDPVDSWLAYRLIEPGYELWNAMGIYQRHLESFRQEAIVENKTSDNNCVNCHSFCMQNPDKMLFHMREVHPCTMLTDGEKVEKLNTQTKQTLSALVYPSWHPGGRFVAFSTNTTKQAFHLNDPNQIEVYDAASDVVVYDTQKHEIVTTSRLSSEQAFETFPTFSPNGLRLFFCTTGARVMPDEYRKAKYSLCSISFDPTNRQFGTEVDTLYQAELEGGSVSFPRVSPDGKYLMYTHSGYGNFSIWHKDADLRMVNLATGQHASLDILNSSDVESYHSWSSNSRWVVFSSRRLDGLYTRPFLAFIGADGTAHKPFLLPQEETDFYFRSLKSYNIPEFITGKVKQQGRTFGLKAQKEKGVDVRFSSSEE